KCGYSYSEIAKAVWGRQHGHRRPSVSQATRSQSERSEQLMRRYLNQGLSYADAQRRTNRAIQGSEAPALSMVRAAIAREHQHWTRTQGAIAAPPACLEPVAGALTVLLREVNPLDGRLAIEGRRPEVDALRRAVLARPQK